jgi:crotonobetainyl-CoA:carnitine CoA-transferase CaiB-like acyl-CoA transferase
MNDLWGSHLPTELRPTEIDQTVIDPLEIDRLVVTGADPVLPTHYAAGTAAATSVGAFTLSTAHLWHQRGGPDPLATVDTRHATLAFRSERYLRVNGTSPTMWDPLTRDYRTSDGWVRLHANYPNHRDAIARALGVPARPETVAAAAATRTAVDIETAVVEAGGAAAAYRTPRQWAQHPQRTALAALPLIAWTRLTDSPALPLSPADRPLGKIRVLDLTRVIAGPVAGRSLAAYGAEVLRVGADHLPLLVPLLLDTGLGKRFCHLDLRTAAGRDTLNGLVATADVLIQAYRPGAVRRLGFGPEQCAAHNPHLVYVSISAWGQTGPWRDRRGFDSLVQMATGLCADQDRPDQPVPLPAQLLDHATGWLAATAAVDGLRRRAASGGAWHAELSLARTGAWLDGLGRITATATEPPYPDDLMSAMDSPHGELTYLRPPGTVNGAIPYWDRPPPAPGADPPQWTNSPGGPATR